MWLVSHKAEIWILVEKRCVPPCDKRLMQSREIPVTLVPAANTMWLPQKWLRPRVTNIWPMYCLPFPLISPIPDVSNLSWYSLPLSTDVALYSFPPEHSRPPLSQSELICEMLSWCRCCMSTWMTKNWAQSLRDPALNSWLFLFKQFLSPFHHPWNLAGCED